MTIRLQTTGISLLEPRLTAYDSTGTVLGQSQSTNLFGDVVTLRVSHVKPDKTYYLKVEGAVADDFGTGRYGVAVIFDAKLTLSADRIDAVLRESADDVAEAIDEALREREDAPCPADSASSSRSDAPVELKTRCGLPEHSFYTATGNLADAAAASHFRVETPETESGEPVVLTAALDGRNINGAQVRFEVFDDNGKPIPAEPLVRGPGGLTVQAMGLNPGTTYFIKVYDAGDSEASVKYRLTLDFRQPASLMRTLTHATLSAAVPEINDTLQVTRTALFQFALSLDAPAATPVLMTVADATGANVFEQTITAGDAVIASVRLSPGTYTVRFSSTAPDGSLQAPVTYMVRGGVLSDPIGPKIEDPNALPAPTCSPLSPKPECSPSPTAFIDPFVWIRQVF